MKKEITANQVSELARVSKVEVSFLPSGRVRMTRENGDTVAMDSDSADGLASIIPCGSSDDSSFAITMDEPGYYSLAEVLNRAFLQAAKGKGKDRHAQGEPFDQQVMQQGADRFGVGSLLFQAFKKSEESQRLPFGPAIAELLGAINYLAGAVVAMERNRGKESPPDAANSNDSEGWQLFKPGSTQPVKGDVFVWVKFANGDISVKPFQAKQLRWSISGGQFDIVAYRVTTESSGEALG